MVDWMKKSVQNASGTIFSRGVATWVSPFFEGAHPHRTWSAGQRARQFSTVEDNVDAATPMDAKNAPTGVWKSRKEREISTASTLITLLLDEDKNEEQYRSGPVRTN